MKIHLSDPSRARSLLAALGESDCAATAVGGAVEVRLPWVRTIDDERQAPVELLFFVRSWAAAHPGVAFSLGG